MGLEEQELTSASAPPTTPSSVAATKATAQSSLVASTAAEGAPAPATVAAAAAAAAMVTGTPTIFREDAKEDAPTNQKASYSPYSTTDKGAGTAPSPHNLNAAVVAVSTDTLEQQQKLQELPSPPPKPLQDQQSERRSSVVSTATAFMRRGTRSDSVSSVPDNTEHNPIVSGMVTSSSPPLIHANVATLSSSNSTKPSKRTSKLFGKLVPKFLQTNNLNTTPSSSGPQSAYPASPSPLSAMTRPTRSASFAAGSSSPMATKSTTEDVAAEAARRTQLPALPSLSESVVRSNEDWLRLSDDQRSQRSVSTLSSVEEKRPERPAMSSRATSHLSNKSTKSMRSSAQETTMSSPTLATKETTICLNNSGINVKGDEQKDTQTTESKMNDGQNETQEQIRNGQGTRSPYIIDDEDCDDDFFLKSVLRKNNSTTRPQAPPMLETGWRSNGSYSNERTPSLSTSANSSSQTSSVSGSPTSPMPPMFTPSSTPVATSAPQHQFSSLQFDRQAAVRQQVVDEKRSRLHDAVGEWRRSSNRSSGSMSGGSSG
ncbi:hypothetical protein BGZ83_007596 [Gryganskiella cystojenkinii]|nr:hypothetical protein BGZ83_007596 [Gryganskiella cystojenkinii]